jgi:hypothetical protein
VVQPYGTTSHAIQLKADNITNRKDSKWQTEEAKVLTAIGMLHFFSILNRTENINLN